MLSIRAVLCARSERDLGFERVSASGTGEGAALRQRDGQQGAPTCSECEAWLIAVVCARTAAPLGAVDPMLPFDCFGLDSAAAVEIVGELSKRFERELPATLLYDHPTISSLAAHLSATDRVAIMHTAPPARGRSEPIAIIGIGCRFPGAENPAAFWSLLEIGASAVSGPPPGRFGAPANAEDPSALGFGAFIDSIDDFDSLAFNISPREAAAMDPQQRLLLEVAFEALDDGALTASLAGSRTGVYIGKSTADHSQLQFSNRDTLDRYSVTGSADAIASNRLSYALDLHGPSMTVDAACSSSLVAINLACQALRDEECEQAIVGAVNVMLTPHTTLGLHELGLLASDGRCKAFASDGDGFVRGEGAGAVVLKPLSGAIEDGDRVLAVIHGSAVNSDGRTNGLIAPSRSAQEALLRDAYRRAGVAPADVSYVEAQGTGSQLADAIEANALATVLSEGRPLTRTCLIGSVKTNIGHLEAAAGMAAVIKVVLAIGHRLLPASLNYTEANPAINFDALPIEVLTRPEHWEPPDGIARLAGISTFGFGGTNAHLVIGEVVGN